MLKYVPRTLPIVFTYLGYTPNKVLGTNVVPDIDESEKTAPRSARTTLAQELQNYKARLNSTISDICPKCGSKTSNVHLFSRPDNPSNLDPTYLWVTSGGSSSLPWPRDGVTTLATATYRGTMVLVSSHARLRFPSSLFKLSSEATNFPLLSNIAGVRRYSWHSMSTSNCDLKHKSERK